MEQQENAMVVVSDGVRIGSLIETNPHAVVERASAIAKELANIIDSRKLYSAIQGKRFVRVEGWSTLGAMLGVTPREVSVVEQADESFEAVVELVRMSDGAIIGRGSAICGKDESTWGNRPRYARRSMAITRATGKAFRLSFSWIMTLAGYEATPAEEIDQEENGNARPHPQQRPVVVVNPEVRQSWAASSKLIARISENIPYYGEIRPHIIASLQKLGESGAIKLTMTNDEVFEIVNQHAGEEAAKKADKVTT